MDSDVFIVLEAQVNQELLGGLAYGFGPSMLSATQAIRF